MPIGKVDSKSFQIAQQANSFLRLVAPSGVGGGSSSPASVRDATDGGERSAAELWRELGGSQDAVSRWVTYCMYTMDTRADELVKDPVEFRAGM